MTYFLRLVAQYLAVVIAVSLFSCALISAMPGDPVDMMLAGNPHATAEDAARLKKIYGADIPFTTRYIGWAGDFLSGDAGYSRLYNQPVTSVMKDALGVTFILSAASFAITLLIALPLGIACAARPRGILDKAVTASSLAGLSCPPFWIGIVLIVLFAVTWGVLPAGGADDGIASYVLPVTTLVLAGLGVYVRHVRGAMMHAYIMTHIRTARAKGASPLRVTLRHALPHALGPVIVLAGLDLGTLLSGTLAIEMVFSLPGMGKTMADAILGNDYNLALFGLMAITVMVLTGNLIADILGRIIDPRLKDVEAA